MKRTWNLSIAGPPFKNRGRGSHAKRIALALFLLILLVISPGCLDKGPTVSPTREIGSTPSPNITFRQTASPTFPIPTITQLQTPLLTATPTSRSAPVTRKRLQCGDNLCPEDWNCCGGQCYNPAEDRSVECRNGTLAKRQPTSCGDIICQGRTSACCNVKGGPVCYDPKTHWCL